MYEIVNVQYTGTYNNGGTSIPAVMGEFRASSAADLPAQNVDCHIICGCDGLDIATGDRYIWNGTAWILQPSDHAFFNVYTKTEIDTMINAIYQTMLYYHTAQESTDGTITFYTLGGSVGRIDIFGNGEQNGTPTPAAPITPDLCGTIDGTDWTIPITCGGQTTPVYLGQVSTVRKIRKLVLTGTESNWSTYSVQDGSYCAFLPLQNFMGAASSAAYAMLICTHYVTTAQNNIYNGIRKTGCSGRTNQGILIRDENITSETDFKAFLQQQYSADNPVTIWYALATPETGIVNEPLAKIGTYADELHITSADISIPTVSGENTLTVDTDLKPSNIIISGGDHT